MSHNQHLEEFQKMKTRVLTTLGASSSFISHLSKAIPKMVYAVFSFILKLNKIITFNKVFYS